MHVQFEVKDREFRFYDGYDGIKGFSLVLTGLNTNNNNEHTGNNSR